LKVKNNVLWGFLQMNNTRQFYGPNWSLNLSLLAFLIVICLLILNSLRFGTWLRSELHNKYQLDQPSDTALEVVGTETLWQLPLLPAQEATFKKITLPRLTPTLVLDFGEGTRLGGETLSFRLRDLIKGHPEPEIREDFFKLIESGEIALSWETDQAFSAEFRVIPQESIAWSQNTITRGEQPVLGVNPRWLASLATDEEITTALLVIYHEFQHYKIWLGDTYRNQMLMYCANEAEKTAECDSYHFTLEDECTSMWFSELEAYRRECVLANQWGVTALGGLCAYAETEFWPQAMYKLQTISSTGPYCKQIFARLAGHPDPDSL